jgi:hypothetical protein
MRGLGFVVMETSGLIVVVQLVWAWIGLFRAVRTRVQVREQLLEEQEKEEDEQEPAGRRTAGTIASPRFRCASRARR